MPRTHRNNPAKRIISSHDYDGPLPDHTKIDIWECYAKHVLRFIDADAYKDLMHSDKPDLIDVSHSLGVEVTDAIEPKSREADSCFAKLSEAEDPKYRERLTERIEQCGATCNGGILFGPNGTDSFDLIHNALKAKLVKLNDGGYQHCKRYELFVHSDIFASECMLQQALATMVEISLDFSRIYTMVTVTVPENIYRFDLENKHYAHLSFESNDQRRIGMIARQEVIDAELKKP